MSRIRGVPRAAAALPSAVASANRRRPPMQAPGTPFAGMPFAFLLPPRRGRDTFHVLAASRPPAVMQVGTGTDREISQ